VYSGGVGVTRTWALRACTVPRRKLAAEEVGAIGHRLMLNVHDAQASSNHRIIDDCANIAQGFRESNKNIQHDSGAHHVPYIVWEGPRAVPCKPCFAFSILYLHSDNTADKFFTNITNVALLLSLHRASPRRHCKLPNVCFGSLSSTQPTIIDS
jgi:hypothetical protein